MRISGWRHSLTIPLVIHIPLPGHLNQPDLTDKSKQESSSSLVTPAGNYQSLQLIEALASVWNQRLDLDLSLPCRLDRLSWCQARAHSQGWGMFSISLGSVGQDSEAMVLWQLSPSSHLSLSLIFFVLLNDHIFTPARKLVYPSLKLAWTNTCTRTHTHNRIHLHIYRKPVSL